MFRRCWNGWDNSGSDAARRTPERKETGKLNR